MPAPIKTTKSNKPPILSLAVVLKTEHGEVKGQIMKLTLQGFMAEFEGLKLQPGDFVSASFRLRGPNGSATKNVTATGRTIKFYSQWAVSPTKLSGKVVVKRTGRGPEKSAEKGHDKLPGKIGHLVEIHFVDILSETLELISDFLRSGASSSDF